MREMRRALMQLLCSCFLPSENQNAQRNNMEYTQNTEQNFDQIPGGTGNVRKRQSNESRKFDSDLNNGCKIGQKRSSSGLRMNFNFSKFVAKKSVTTAPMEKVPKLELLNNELNEKPENLNAKNLLETSEMVIISEEGTDSVGDMSRSMESTGRSGKPVRFPYEDIRNIDESSFMDSD